jgi:NAD(P)H-dependent FMN reductase
MLDRIEPATLKQAHVCIIATSLNPDSKSLILAQRAHHRLQELGVSASLSNLRDLPLPLCDGTQAISHDANAWKLRQEVQRATHVLFALPIYNYAVNAAAKNVIELLFNWGCWYEDEWDEYVMGKTAGLLCAGGNHHSRMAALSFANSLMMECWWWIVPHQVYAVTSDFESGRIVNQKTLDRIDRLLEHLLQGPRISAMRKEGTA